MKRNIRMSDSAASGVTRAAEIEEEETCDMHDGGKVGQSATGRLVRTPSTWPWSVVDLTQTRDFSESEEEGE
jgi:hypothetical protein